MIFFRKNNFVRLLLLLAVVVHAAPCRYVSDDAKSPERELCNDSIWDKPINIAPNEARIDLFFPFVKNIGGGYLGVGGVQNLILASWAKSERIWLVDCTKRVFASNIIHLELLKYSKNFSEFRTLWSMRGKRRAYEIIAQMPDAHNISVSYYQQTWEMGVDYMTRYFALLDELSRKLSYRTCFDDDFLFSIMRSRAHEGKILVRTGKLEGDVALKEIAREAEKMHIAFRVLYLSNAEEYFREYPENFLKNIRALPFDATSIVLRTASFFQNEYPRAEFSERLNNRGFHYNVMDAELFRSLAFGNAKNVYHVLRQSRPMPVKGLSVHSRSVF